MARVEKSLHFVVRGEHHRSRSVERSDALLPLVDFQLEAEPQAVELVRVESLRERDFEAVRGKPAVALVVEVRVELEAVQTGHHRNPQVDLVELLERSEVGLRQLLLHSLEVLEVL